MSDDLESLIHGAFAEFDAAERFSHLPAPGASAVRRRVTIQRRVRRTAFSVAAALLIAVPVAAYAARPWGNNSPPGGVASVSPSVPVSPTGTTSPTSSPTPSAPTAPPVDVRNTTLDLPAFPGGESYCKAAGVRTFVDGTATPAEPVKLIIGEIAPIMADLDGVPGDEELTTIRCQTPASINLTQLLALKVGPDGALTPLGYVINSPDTSSMDATWSRENITVDNGVVRLTVNGPHRSDGWPPCDPQVRGYAYRDGAFRQVSGPTSFHQPTKNFHQLDFRNTGLLVGFNYPDGSDRFYCVRMANGAGEVDVYDNRDARSSTTHYRLTIGPVS